MNTPLPPIPSKPPTAEGNLGAVLQWCFTKLLQKTDGQLPAKIIKYDRARNVATVQPLISILATSGAKIDRAPIAEVPVLALGGGGFFVNFPLGPGDTGWIEASDRDISLYMQSAEIATPNTKRLHSFEDGRFVPDIFANYSFSLPSGAMVISSLDGSTRIELSASGINLIAPHVTVTSPTVAVNATSVNVTANTIDASASSQVILPANTSVGGKLFGTHKHSGVTTGGGQSGGVV